MKKKNKTRSVTGLLFGFMERVSGDHVGAYATQAAYFLIMSFIPCILFSTLFPVLHIYIPFVDLGT